MKQFTCPECGGTVRPTKGPGRYARHYTMRFEIPHDLATPKCDECGEEWVDKATAEKVDKALSKLYRAELQRRAKAAIETLMEHAKQQDAETFLGLSQGYVSHLRAGRKTPSPDLVALLALLAADPRRRLREVEDFWGGDPREKEHHVGTHAKKGKHAA